MVKFKQNSLVKVDGLKTSRNYVDKCKKAKKDENLVAKGSDPARLSRVWRILNFRM